MAGASAEIFGAGSLLKQLSIYPQPVLVALALITAGSIIPIVKGTEGGYLDSLFDTYALPKDWFTQVRAGEVGDGRRSLQVLGLQVTAMPLCCGWHCQGWPLCPPLVVNLDDDAFRCPAACARRLAGRQQPLGH